MAVSFNGPDTVDRLLGDWIGASSWIPFSHQMLADFRAASHWVEDLDAGSPDTGKVEAAMGSAGPALSGKMDFRVRLKPGMDPC